MEVGVDDCHVGKKLVVSKRILHTGLFVGDNRKRSNLRSCTCGGRNRDEVSLLTHLGEGINSLTDIDKSHCHIHKVCFGMLVKNPHDLCSVHCGTAAECDDGIGLECSHKSCSLGCVSKRRIGLYVKERSVLNAHLVQLIGDRLRVAVLVKEAVGYDERLLCASYGSELIESNGEATLFYINLLGCSEPKHIFSPLGYCFNVEQVLNTYVLGYAVTAPRAASKRERGSELEVVKVADTAVCGGRIYENTAGSHSAFICGKLFLLGDLVDVKRGSMTKAAVLNKLICLVKRFCEGLSLIHSKYGRELLVSEFLGELYALNLSDEDLGAGRNGYACELSDLSRLLTNDFRVKPTIYDDSLTNLFGFHRIKEIASACRKLCLNNIVDAFKHDNRLLGRADHTVIEGLGVNDRVNCKKNVCGFIDNCGRVTCTNTESRLAGRIRSLNHSGTTGREDDVCLLHYGVSHIKRRYIDPIDDSFGCSCCYCGFKNELCSRDGRVLCSGVRADNNGITSLECEQALEDCGGSGVSRGDNGSNNADRLCDLSDTESLVLFDHAAGLGFLVSVINIFRSVVVLDDLVLYDAHSGFLNRELCKRDSCLVCSGSRCQEDLINLLLSIGCENLLCRSYTSDRTVKCFNTVNDFVSFGFHFICPPKIIY